jgi:putative oxidoreductase
MHRIVSLATALNALATRIASALDWLPPTLARLVVGTVFFQSGWGKLHSLPDVTQFFTELGLPMPAFQAVLASSAEFICGALLLAGLATRFAVVPLIVTMIVAIRTALWDQVEGVASLFTLAEFLYIGLLVWLGVSGAGPLSLDALLSHRTPVPSAQAARERLVPMP